MAPGQKRCQHSEVQICLLLPEHDCGPVIGKKGSRITTYHQETGCQVFVHNDYRHILKISISSEIILTEFLTKIKLKSKIPTFLSFSKLFFMILPFLKFLSFLITVFPFIRPIPPRI